MDAWLSETCRVFVYSARSTCKVFSPLLGKSHGGPVDLRRFTTVFVKFALMASWSCMCKLSVYRASKNPEAFKLLKHFGTWIPCWHCWYSGEQSDLRFIFLVRRVGESYNLQKSLFLATHVRQLKAQTKVEAVVTIRMPKHGRQLLDVCARSLWLSLSFFPRCRSPFAFFWVLPT